MVTVFYVIFTEFFYEENISYLAADFIKLSKNMPQNIFAMADLSVNLQNSFLLHK